MSAQRASTPVRLARAAAALVLMALAAVIALRLAGKRPGAAASSASTAAVEPPPEGRVVDLKERVRHQEYKDGRPVIDVRGASLSRGADGRNHLEGTVEVLSLGSGGETVSRLTADEVAYDPGSLRFTVSGHVRVETGDGLVLEGDSFDYDKGAGLFGTTSGGRFWSAKLSGQAPEISYRESAGEIRLGRGFVLELPAAERSGEALTVSGDSFRYVEGERRGRIEGRASIQGLDFRAMSENAAFLVRADESSLASAALEGAAAIVLTGKGPAGEGSGEMRADRLDLFFSREPSTLAIRSSSETSLTMRSGAERAETLLAPAALLNVSREDGRCTWLASGGIRVEMTGSAAVRRTVEGAEASFDAAEVLHVTGGPNRPAVADSEEARIEAPWIGVNSASGEVQAMGGVACLLKKSGGRRAVGFFSPQEDISVSSERLDLKPEASVSLFSGKVVVRQGQNILRAERLESAGDTGRMSGGKGVSITLVEPASAEGPGRTVELEGEELDYRSDERALTLSSHASVRLPEAKLEASTVTAVVGPGGRTVESLAAAKSVAVSHGRYTGRSQAAKYEASTGRLILTGKPVLTDDKGGAARGAKLTFSLSDDKIFIENEGPGRATTVVRS
jgi:lipopolysaccharide export system protein LptA